MGGHGKFTHIQSQLIPTPPATGYAYPLHTRMPVSTGSATQTKTPTGISISISLCLCAWLTLSPNPSQFTISLCAFQLLLQSTLADSIKRIQALQVLTKSKRRLDCCYHFYNVRGSCVTEDCDERMIVKLNLCNVNSCLQELTMPNQIV